MNNIAGLTRKYVKLFDQKDIEGLENMFHENIQLTDPNVDVKGSKEVIGVVSGIFNSFDRLSFHAENIYTDGSNSIIEFTLKLDDDHLTGTDIIEWESGKIRALRAYLYQKS